MLAADCRRSGAGGPATPVPRTPTSSLAWQSGRWQLWRGGRCCCAAALAAAAAAAAARVSRIFASAPPTFRPLAPACLQRATSTSCCRSSSTPSTRELGRLRRARVAVGAGPRTLPAPLQLPERLAAPRPRRRCLPPYLPALPCTLLPSPPVSCFCTAPYRTAATRRSSCVSWCPTPPMRSTRSGGWWCGAALNHLHLRLFHLWPMAARPSASLAAPLCFPTPTTCPSPTSHCCPPLPPSPPRLLPTDTSTNNPPPPYTCRRYQSLTDKSLLDSQPELYIHIVPDKTNNTLSIIDSGIGMTKVRCGAGGRGRGARLVGCWAGRRVVWR